MSRGRPPGGERVPSIRVSEREREREIKRDRERKRNRQKRKRKHRKRGQGTCSYQSKSMTREEGHSNLE